ncbi:MAG TPA: ribokinase [bacterium]|jgi:ribokinase|nr:ribokinase [bacterium]
MTAVCVVGSLNMDLVIKAPRLPARGETVTEGEFAVFRGGKGANQAVAAARLGAQVSMIGCVGDDLFGRQLLNGLRGERIETRAVRVDRGAPSGVALITVDPAGHNTIVVAPGANRRLTASDVDAGREAIAQADVVLAQLEVPMEAVLQAARLGRAQGRPFVLDPAPAAPLPAELYECVSLINPNEGEAQRLTGIDVDDEAGVRAAAEILLARGSGGVVIKLGEKGAFVAAGGTREMVEGVKVQAVDTTAAGDAFAAALAVALAEGRDVVAATRFANLVGAMSVTRMGAQASMPTRDEVAALAPR